MKIIPHNIIGKIVAEDYRTAAVFKKYDIDFCCHGNRTLEEACKQNSIDIGKVLKDLEAIQQNHDNTFVCC